MENKIDNALNSILAILSNGNSSTTITRTINTDPQKYLEAFEIAEEEYERIRNDPHDINKICNNLSKEQHVVLRVKNHIFVDMHTIIYQDNTTKYGRLDADPEIVNAWDRLASNTHIDSDITFFAHEEYESSIEKAQGLTYNEAHRLTEAAGYIWILKEE